MLWLPNFVSLLRLAAAPVVAWLLLTAHFRAALLLLLLAGVTDWVDGYLARLLHAPSGMGVVLDPLADKALLIVVFVAMGVAGLVPVWLFALVVGRDLVVVAGSLLLRWLRNRREFRPSYIGKVSTFFQIVFALLALVYAAFPWEIVQELKFMGVVLTAIFTVLSGLEYVRRGIVMARQPALDRIEAK